jgi:hypothetical protein
MASGKRSMWLTLVAMTLANSMILVDQTAVPLATPDVVHDLAAPLDLSQWLLTANILPLQALMVFGGGSATCSACAASSSPGRSSSVPRPRSPAPPRRSPG